MEAPRHGVPGHYAGNFHTPIGGEEGDQNKAEDRHAEGDRLHPRGAREAGRRRRLNDQAGEQSQRDSPGQETGEGNRAGARVCELRDLLTQRVVGGHQQRLDCDGENEKAEGEGGSDDSPST